MRVRDLRAVLEGIRSVLKTARASSHEKALGKVASGLEGHDDAPLASYLEHLRRKADEATAPLADQFARRLSLVNLDEEKFNQVIQDLKQTRKLKKADLQKIAAAYTGSFDRRASVEKLIDDIKLSFYTKVYERDSGEIASRANPV
jgi:hypothetical protein